MLRAVRSLKESLPSLITAISIYLFVTALDYATTLANEQIPGVYEGNPFARHPFTLRFWPSHALIGDFVMLLFLLLVALTIYECAKPLSRKVADVLATAPFLYLAYDRLTDAVFHNLLLHLGFYVGNPY